MFKKLLFGLIGLFSTVGAAQADGFRFEYHSGYHYRHYRPIYVYVAPRYTYRYDYYIPPARYCEPDIYYYPAVAPRPYYIAPAPRYYYEYHFDYRR
jgi:hypothetical protein